MQINDRVRCESGEEGTIIAIFRSDVYMIFYEFTHREEFIGWSSYPDWKEKPVYKVHLDVPRKSATLEQWVSTAIEKGINKEEAQKDYFNCPVVSCWDVAHDSIQLVKKEPK